MNAHFNPEMVAIILASAVATYVTRIGGYVLIRKMKTYRRAWKPPSTPCPLPF